MTGVDGIWIDECAKITAEDMIALAKILDQAHVPEFKRKIWVPDIGFIETKCPTDTPMYPVPTIKRGI